MSVGNWQGTLNLGIKICPGCHLLKPVSKYIDPSTFRMSTICTECMMTIHSSSTACSDGHD